LPKRFENGLSPRMPDMENNEITLELRFVNSKHFNRVLLAAIGLIALYVPVATLYFGGRYLGLDGIPDQQLGKTISDFRLMLLLWFFVFLPVILIPLLFVARGMRVIVNDAGIHFRSGLPKEVKFLAPDWTVGWNELQGATWQLAPGKYIASRLTLRTKGGKYRISPWHWVEKGARVDVYFPKLKCTKEEAGALLRRTPLIERMRSTYSDYRDDSYYQARPPLIDLGFDGVDVTPLTAMIAAAFIALVCSFIIEIYFTASEFYAGDAPCQLIGLSALLGFLIVLRTLRHFEPRRQNSALYALLFGLGAGLATYPFLVRVNAWTDSDGLREYDYRLGTDYVWRSVLPGTPDLEMYLSGSAWWRQFVPGDGYTFELRKGGLGFWQVNMTSIYEAQKKYAK
jgi:hypothetical protein